ncbi:MAG: DUF2934 domain-containing protein [Candidatus Omnitrophota bacterium]
MAKLCVKAFGISCGLVVAALTFVVGTLNIIFYIESGLSKALAILYFGYAPTILGVVINSLWGFIFAFVLGALIAWLYNRIIEESKQEVDEKIKALALSIWESKGKPEGTSADDWREAQIKIRGF